MTVQPPEIPRADAVITETSWHDLIDLVSPDHITVSTVDQLRHITPTMFAWWFAHITTESYQLFHPEDHANFAWTAGKEPDSYVGATHRTHHRYGGQDPVLRSAITFLPPQELFSELGLGALGGGHALAACARPLDASGAVSGPISGYFVHVVLPRDHGSELRSKWWLAVDADTDLDLVTHGRTRHVHEEFDYLQGFLPHQYHATVEGAVT